MADEHRPAAPDDAEIDSRGVDELFKLAVGVLQRVSRGTQGLSGRAALTLVMLDRYGPQRVTDLALAAGISQPSMTALVRGLERSGMVERQSNHTDQRAVLVAITAAGANYLAGRRQSGTDVLRRLIGELSPTERMAFRAAVPAIEHMRELDDRDRLSPRTPKG